MKYISVILGVALLFGCQSPVSDVETVNSIDGLTDPVDRFAAVTLINVQDDSFANNREYCGYIVRNETGEISATKALKGDVDGCLPKAPQNGLIAIASYHTHGAEDRDSDTEVPSLYDLEADIYEGVDGYISTPGGRLWKIRKDSKDIVLLCAAGCMLRDPQYSTCANRAPGEYHNKRSLTKRDRENIGTC